MAKKISGYIKLQVPAGTANPSPPLGPALGQRGVNIMEFCKAFNAATGEMEKGMPIPTVITVFADRSFTFIMKTPPAAVLIRKAIGIEKGKPFAPDAERRKLLDEAARTAFKMSKVVTSHLLPKEPGGLYYKDRQFVNTFAGENTEFQASGTFTTIALSALDLKLDNITAKGTAGIDLTGADLSGLDLREANFEGAWLESVNFSNSNLSGANFKSAVLAHAQFDGAIAVGASFLKTNLGKARLAQLYALLDEVIALEQPMNTEEADGLEEDAA